MLDSTNYQQQYQQHFATSAIVTVTAADLARQAKTLTGTQCACLAVELHNKKVMVEPTLSELARILGVTPRYAQMAQTLLAEQREAILRNRDASSVASIIRARHSKPTDAQVRRIIERAGLSKVLLEAAVVAESIITA
jgi:hypothetical protein